MTGGVRVRALGVDILLATERPAVRVFLEREWARCLVREDQAAGSDGPPREVPLDGLPEVSLGYGLATAVTRLAIEASIGRLLLFHAAGLADDAGRVLMLVAPSGTGKTTAAAALARSGWGYVSDETVAISADLRVVPYPKPLAVLDGPGPKVQRSPDDLGLRGCPESLRIHRVVLLERVRGSRVAPSLDRLALLDGLLELIPQTSSLAALERPLQRLCEVSDACGCVYRLTYSDIGDAEGLVAALARDEPASGDGRPLEPWAALGEPPAATSAASAGGLMRRAPYVDAVDVGGEGLVLVGLVPVRLGPLGLTLWRAAGSGATEEALVAAAIREHGPHPGAAATVRSALASMLGAGLLLT